MTTMTLVSTITKWGNSQGIRLNKNLLSLSNMALGDSISITADGQQIIIQKIARKRRSLDELFAGYNGNYQCQEADFGKSVGKEI